MLFVKVDQHHCAKILPNVFEFKGQRTTFNNQQSQGFIRASLAHPVTFTQLLCVPLSDDLDGSQPAYNPDNMILSIVTRIRTGTCSLVVRDSLT